MVIPPRLIISTSQRIEHIKTPLHQILFLKNFQLENYNLALILFNHNRKCLIILAKITRNISDC
mgnify:CR=1 FL=1